MAQEIERKFLVRGDAWRTEAGIHIRQGYIHNDINGTVRVRTKGERAYLTIKGSLTGIMRTEFEYEIPLEDANQILDELCQRPLIEKIRHEIDVDGFTWEIELENEGQEFPKPDWLGEEVSQDARYLNANLVKNPYSKWT